MSHSKCVKTCLVSHIFHKHQLFTIRKIQSAQLEYIMWCISSYSYCNIIQTIHVSFDDINIKVLIFTKLINSIVPSGLGYVSLSFHKKCFFKKNAVSYGNKHRTTNLTLPCSSLSSAQERSILVLQVFVYCV